MEHPYQLDCPQWVQIQSKKRKYDDRRTDVQKPDILATYIR